MVPGTADTVMAMFFMFTVLQLVNCGRGGIVQSSDDESLIQPYNYIATAPDPHQPRRSLVPKV